MKSTELSQGECYNRMHLFQIFLTGILSAVSLTCVMIMLLVFTYQEPKNLLM